MQQMQSFGKMFVQSFKKISVLSFLLFLFAVFPSVSFGSTNVCGPVFSDTTWDLAGSPYIVTCNILINEGVTLTIEPGVEVRFNATYSIQIDGDMVARGTKDKWITFTSNIDPPKPRDWGCIEFNRSGPKSIMEYCKVEYGGYDGFSGGNSTIKIKYTNNGEGSLFSINHCIIKNCSTYSNGIVYICGSRCHITNSTISDNLGRGIYTEDNFEICILDNIISDNRQSENSGGGISSISRTKWFQPSPAIIIGNEISNNIGDCGGGIAFYGAGTIDKNIITNNEARSGGGIHYSGANEDYRLKKISNNMISNNHATEESVYGNGGGIYCSHIENGVITSNIIKDNSAYHRGGAIYCGGIYTNLEITNNTIENNSAGTCGGISTACCPASLKIADNNLSNPGQYELYGSVTIDAKNNWWGTNIQSEIMGKIYDWYDDSA